MTKAFYTKEGLQGLVMDASELSVFLCTGSADNLCPDIRSSLLERQADLLEQIDQHCRYLGIYPQCGAATQNIVETLQAKGFTA